MTDQPSVEEFTVNGAQVWIKSDNPHLKQFIIEAVRDHDEEPSYFPKAPTESHCPDVIERGSAEIQYRFAKEAIGMAAIELNRAYADFTIDGAGVDIPTGRLQEASHHLLAVMSLLDVSQPRIPVDPTDDLPF